MAESDFYKKKKVLITGARGYIGSALAEKLSHTGCNLVLHNRQEADLSQRASWKGILKEIDVVFHLVSFDYKDFNPLLDLSVNALSVLWMLEECREQNLKPKIIFASTSNIAGQVHSLPVDEQVPDLPPSLFAIHKLLAENYLKLYAREFGVPSVSLRLANIYGPVAEKATARRVVLNRLISRALESGKLTLLKNQDSIRDFLYINDTVDGFLLAGATEGEMKGETYYLSSGDNLSFARIFRLVAKVILETTGRRIVVDCDNSIKIRNSEMRDFCSKSQKFRERFGWSPKVSLEQGIKKTVEYFS